MNGFALNNIQNAYVGSTPAQAIYLGSTLIWPTTPPHDYSQDYLTIVSLANNNVIGWKYHEYSASSPGWNRTISVSTDDGSTWTNYTSSAAGTTLATLNSGDKLLIKGNNNNYSDGTDYNCFESSNYINVQGNIMSLIYEDNFIGQTTLSANYTFSGLFSFNTINGQNVNIINAQNLILPATTLALGCYKSMFRNCSSLVTAPVLPATTLTEFCYAEMFYGCSSLVTAPVIYATTLADGCYDCMFYGCSSLVTAPVLPATTLAYGCYGSMFAGCTSLVTAPVLPATTLAESCYDSMFAGCTSLVTAPVLPATTLADGCYGSMFAGCTSLVTAPVLPATTLALKCYDCMFQDCTSLNYIKCLATDISATDATYNWVNGVSASGTFTKDATMSSWTTGKDGIPSGWTVINA